MRKRQQEKKEMRTPPAHGGAVVVEAGKPPKVKKQKPPKAPKESRRTVGDFFRSRIVIGFICVIVALLIAFVGFPIVQGMVSERVPVVVSAGEIEKGTLLMPEMLEVTEIGAIDRPKNAAVSVAQAVGTYAKYNMAQGDLVLSSKLSRERPLANPYLYELPDDKVAISVSVQGLAQGLSGKLKPGDIVSVYAVWSKSDAEVEYAAMQPLELKYVRVLAVSNSTGVDIDVDDIQIRDEAATTDNLPATITLMAGDYQAAALAGLDVNSTIYVGLAARASDDAVCASMLAAQEEYIAIMEEEDEAGTGDGAPEASGAQAAEDAASAGEAIAGEENQEQSEVNPADG